MVKYPSEEHRFRLQRAAQSYHNSVLRQQPLYSRNPLSVKQQCTTVTALKLATIPPQQAGVNRFAS